MSLDRPVWRRRLAASWLLFAFSFTVFCLSLLGGAAGRRHLRRRRPVRHRGALPREHRLFTMGGAYGGVGRRVRRACWRAQFGTRDHPGLDDPVRRRSALPFLLVGATTLPTGSRSCRRAALRRDGGRAAGDRVRVRPGRSASSSASPTPQGGASASARARGRRCSSPAARTRRMPSVPPRATGRSAWALCLGGRGVGVLLGVRGCSIALSHAPRLRRSAQQVVAHDDRVAAGADADRRDARAAHLLEREHVVLRVLRQVARTRARR